MTFNVLRCTVIERLFPLKQPIIAKFISC